MAKSVYYPAMRPAHKPQFTRFGIFAQRPPIASPSNSLMLLQGKLGQVDSAESKPSIAAGYAAQLRDFARAGFGRYDG